MANIFKLYTIYLNVTDRCNLKCAFCGVASRHSFTQELTKSEIFDLVDQAKDLGTTYCVLIGGEPFMRRDLGEIARYITSRGIRLGIATNGTLITERSLAYMDDINRDMLFLGLSLNGANPSTHDSLCGVPGAFDKALRGIKVTSKKGIRLVIQTVLQSTNVLEIEDIAKIAIEHNAIYHVIPCIIPKGRGVSVVKESNLDIGEILTVANKLADLSVRYGISVIINLPLALLPPCLSEKGAMQCFWGINFCGILANGDVALCHGSDFCNECMSNEFIAGNIRTQKLREIWNNSKMFTFLRSIDPDQFEGVCGKCIIRQYCRGYCRVHAYLEYGSIYAPESLCQWAYDKGLFPNYALEISG